MHIFFFFSFLGIFFIQNLNNSLMRFLFNSSCCRSSYSLRG